MQLDQQVDYQYQESQPTADALRLQQNRQKEQQQGSVHWVANPAIRAFGNEFRIDARVGNDVEPSQVHDGNRTDAEENAKQLYC